MKQVLFYLAKMADASFSVRSTKIPDNLYELCLTNLVNYLQKLKCERNDLRSLPDSVLMDIYYKARHADGATSAAVCARVTATPLSRRAALGITARHVTRRGAALVRSSRAKHVRACFAAYLYGVFV
ncbi:unnamed protein product, partial [Iphiclides podalirius]